MSRVHAIGIRDVASQRERIVTPAMRWIDMPRWSPDGRRLLVRGIGVTNGYGFFLVDVDSGATTALKTVPLMEEDALGPGQWDASGHAVIYVRGGVFFRVDVETRQEERLFALPEGAWLCSLSGPGLLGVARRWPPRVRADEPRCHEPHGAGIGRDIPRGAAQPAR